MRVRCRRCDTHLDADTAEELARRALAHRAACDPEAEFEPA